MDFDKIRLTGANVIGAIDLPVKGGMVAPSDLFIVKGVDGLGPADIDVFIANTPNRGGVYQGRRPQNKEIVIQMGLNPDYSSGQTPSDLRSYVYGMLTGGYTGASISFILMTADDDEVARTTGWVKKCETVVFQKEQVVQVTLATVSPYLNYLFRHVVDVDDFDGDGFADPMPTDNPNFTNVGDAPTGVHMKLIMTSSYDYWELKSASNERLVKFDLMGVHGIPVTAGDIIEFNTEPGSRFARLTIDGTGEVINLLAAMTKDSVWFQLYSGLNQFSCDQENYNWLEIDYEVHYWGI